MEDTSNKPVTPSTPTAPTPTPAPVDSFTPPPAPPTPPTSIPEPAKPKKRNLKALMIAIIAVATLSAAGAFAYFGVYVPNLPENVVKAALANFMAAESASARGSADLRFSNFSVKPNFNVDVAADGGVAVGLSTNIGGNDLSLEARQTQDDAYLKVSGLAGFGDDWMEALATYGFSDDQVSTVDDLIRSIDSKWLAFNDSLSSETETLPRIEQSELSAAFGEREVIVSAEKVGEETVNNRPSSHYKVSINKDELKSGIDALSAETLDADEKTQLKEMIDELDLTDIELWVYDDSKELAKFSHAGSLGDSEGDGDYNFELIFVSFNQTPNIVAPTDTINGLELWLDLQNSLQLDQLYPGGFEGIPADSLEAF